MPDVDDFLSTVEKIGNVPIVMFPYGVKVIEHGGKRYLSPMDKDDLIEALKRDGFDERHALARECLLNGHTLECINNGCPHTCVKRGNGVTGYYCTCS